LKIEFAKNVIDGAKMRKHMVYGCPSDMIDIFDHEAVIFRDLCNGRFNFEEAKDKTFSIWGCVYGNLLYKEAIKDLKL
jgi:hypothetical protein